MNQNFKLVQAIREQFGRQNVFAREVCLDEAYLSKVVNGWREPKQADKEKIASALKCKVTEIFPEEK